MWSLLFLKILLRTISEIAFILTYFIILVLTVKLVEKEMQRALDKNFPILTELNILPLKATNSKAFGGQR